MQEAGRYRAMSSKKGLSMAIQLIITAVVLIMVAITILLLYPRYLPPTPAKEEGLKQICLSMRDSYCEKDREGCWNSASDFAKADGKKCSELLKTENKPYFDCSKKTETEGWITEAEKTSRFGNKVCGP
jgi:hypothetical protein